MIAAHKGEIPFAILLLPFLAGIGSGIWFPVFSLTTILTVILSGLIVLFISLNLLYKKLNLHKFKWTGGALIYSILFTLGWTITLKYNELNSKDHFSKKPADYLLVKINNEPKLNGDLLRFTAVVEDNVKNGKATPASGNLLITIKDSTARNLYYGDELMIPANYHPVDPPYNPGEFNYKQYLANQNIHYQEFLYAHQYYVIAKNNGIGLISYSLRIRQLLVEKFKRHMHSPEAVAVASTLILGYKADLSNDVLQAYSKTGTIHVLSVSGAHVAILFLVLDFMLGFLNRLRYGKTLKAILVILVIWYYSLLTGFSPAVCRAALMISMIIIGKTYSRYINTLNILAISAFCLLLYDPYFILDVGFQLSYLAVGGLVIFQPIVYKWMDIDNKWLDKLWLACSISIAAQVITFPLSAFYFHQFPVYFLISNLFIIIPSELIMIAGLAYLVMPDIPFVSSALGWVLEKSILLMDKVLSAIEHFPYSSINKIWITPVEYLLLYVIIIAIFYFLYDRKAWWLRLSLICMLLLAVSISYKRWNNSHSNQIAFLNLRKHTGIAFKKGNDAVVLTDLSDTDKTYRYSIQPYLDSNQVENIHLLSSDKNIRLSYFLKESNYMQFQHKSVLVFDKRLFTIQFPEKFHADFLYVSGSKTSDADLDFINKNYDYHSLIIDNSNSNYLINKLQKQAEAQHINYHTLLRNKSILVTSN
ncbi:MAG: ComEC family competence protein [Bacteroidetes bacterium]|jgi:competence protein ComEC|nr:ComEC family competence protein [Bacteroidota bacterium]